jgi:chromosomal replication initiator protein
MENVWQKTLSYIEQRVDTHSFNLWFVPLSFLEYEENRLVISVPDQLFVDWLEENYPDLIQSALEWQDKKDMEVEFVVNAEQQKSQTTSPISDKNTSYTSKRGTNKGRLLLNYTFGSFIVGGSNQFAHAACRAVAEHASQVYNPLYIYGGSGLGKTHLLNAIGNHLLAKSPDTKLVYISMEMFMNELINAIRYEKTTDFRNKYRSIDVLLIDDIQFIAGKERTQEEFFHTFNALYESNKQIVLSSDCPPKNIPTIEDRLRSRFEWGLIADIQIPDLETKIAIIKKKAEKHNFYFPDDVCMLIATNIHSNIRELEGSMTRVMAHSSITGQEITIDLAKEVLKHIIVEKERRITTENIQKTVATFFKIKVAELKSKSRLSAHALPRQVAMYLCRQLTKHSLPAIGSHFGGKDHTTVLHACKKIKKMIDHDPSFKAKISQLNDLIQNGPPT